MKNIVVIFIVLMLMSNQNTIAQYTQVPKNPDEPFSVQNRGDILKQGVWSFNLKQRPLSLGFKSSSTDGEKTGNSFKIGSRVELNYNVLKGFSVGLGYEVGYNNRTKINQGEEDNIRKRTEWGVSGILSYGQYIGEKFPLIGRLRVGYENESYFNSNSETTNKQNSLTTMITLESPVQLTRHIFIVPFIGFENRQSWEEEYSYNKNAFIAGTSLNFYMGCGDDHCDCSGDPVPYEERYRKGDLLIGSKTFASFLTGVKNETYKGEGENKQKDGLTLLHVDGYALYDVIDNLGIGGGLDFGWNNTSSKDYDYSQSRLEAKIKAIARYNLPFNNSLKNIYAETSYAYGFSNRKTDNAGNVTKDNSTVSTFYAGGGYIYHINRQLSLNLSAGYLNTSRKNKDENFKNNRAGFDAGIGIEYIINNNNKLN